MKPVREGKWELTVVLVLTLTVQLVRGAGEPEQDHPPEYEYAPYDGWYNNLAHPDWGAADTQLLRRLPAAYSDGVYEPAGGDRPNPFTLSQKLMKGHTGRPSYREATAFLVFFGQQVVEEVLDAQRPGCPPEYFNIPIPMDNELYNPDNETGREMPLLRSRYDMTTGLSPNNPRQQLNEITPYIDGTLVYGPNKAWTDALRTFEGGLLASTNTSESALEYFPDYNNIRLPFANPPPPRDHYLKPIKRFYKIGNPRGNENPFLLTFGVLWFRYHNYKAHQIHGNHPTWSDERIFNEARKWTIGVYQKIVVYDWLPSWLGSSLPAYTGYKNTIQPAISHEFQSAAMRFGHTMVPPGVFRRGRNNNGQCTFYTNTEKTGEPDLKKQAVRTCNSYWNPQEAVSESLGEELDGVDHLLMGMSSQLAEREDNIITEDLRGSVFGPLDFSRRDLMAINIQRGRDHGLPDYNTARREYGLPEITNFLQINEDLLTEKPELLDALHDLYQDDMSKIDIWVGGILESGQRMTNTNSSARFGPGPLFRAIITDQFSRIRDADRFWYENRLNGLFTDEELEEISRTTVKDVVLAVTNIRDEDIQDNPFFITGTPCMSPVQLNGSEPSHLAACTMMKTFDYFSGSEASYALSFTALGLILIIIIVMLVYIARKHNKDRLKQRANLRPQTTHSDEQITAQEWVGKNAGQRPVVIGFDGGKQQIAVKSPSGKLLRIVDCVQLSQKCQNTIRIVSATDKKQRLIIIKVPHEYDLILRFPDFHRRQEFRKNVSDFLTSQCHPSIGVDMTTELREKDILKQAVTKTDRQELLNRFFRVTTAHAFHYSMDKHASEQLRQENNQDIASCELTKYEFAEALGMKPTSLFVENMFNLVDKNNDGVLSFREFLDVMVIFSKGTAQDKAKLLFDMHDLNQTGLLTVADFKMMLRSMLEIANETVEDHKITSLVESMFEKSRLSHKHELSFEDFMSIMNDYKDVMNYASLNIEGTSNGGGSSAKRENIPSRARKTFYRSLSNAGDQQVYTSQSRMSTLPGSLTTQKLTHEGNIQAPTTGFEQKRLTVTRFFENYRLHIFWVVLYTLVTAGIFIERAYYYSIEREHVGLRRIAGYGVTITRGAASGMMFTYSTLLVTMCRNLITYLRETPVNRYMPLDSAVSFHKYVAWLALFFTVMHCIGHGLNFYHIATQTADDLSCLFRNFFHATDVLPKFHYWCWQTITGFTGVLATIVVMLIYVFAIQYSRRNAFRVFWMTHNLYIVLFILMILHGAGRLVQPPFMHYFCLGPVILFTIDKLISVSRKKVEIPVIRAELLPSDVTYLEFKKPQNFEYKSGQWVRIACPVLGGSEYHPFTISSAPHDPNLSLHIRAVGPWTMNLRQTYDPALLKEHAYPKIHLDGPYGEGHQEWFKYDVAILVGGGIGVTPFASIIKDLAHKSKLGTQFTCKKVYFIWVTRTQKQFEWMTDIIRQVEDSDIKNLLSVHIFVTQFKEKFDIRTTMLYICERHFQKISNRSLFTGLRSITHFGRPDFPNFFKLVMGQHKDTNIFGVFSCGPPPMTLSVEKACANMNKYYKNALFVHHYENF